MKHLILLLLFTFPLSSPASEEFKFNAVVSQHYELTKSGFINGSPQNDTWSIVFTNNSYYLVASTENVPLKVGGVRSLIYDESHASLYSV